MSIKDTIKSLEEADEKLAQAKVHEDAGIAAHKAAAKEREGTKANLEQITAERHKIEDLQTARFAQLQRKDENLKNREATLKAGQLDLARNTAETKSELDNRANSLTARTVELEKREQAVKEASEANSKTAEKYKNIAEFITDRI